MPEESRNDEVVWLDSFSNTNPQSFTAELKLLEWILGHAPYVIPSASAIESLATFGPTKVVGLGGRYANRTASPVLGGGMRIKRRIGPQTLGGLRITAERSTATATGMTTGA